jgi:hypothetical protein
VSRNRDWATGWMAGIRLSARISPLPLDLDISSGADSAPYSFGIGGYFPEIKRPGRETNRSTSTSA